MYIIYKILKNCHHCQFYFPFVTHKLTILDLYYMHVCSVKEAMRNGNTKTKTKKEKRHQRKSKTLTHICIV